MCRQAADRVGQGEAKWRLQPVISEASHTLTRKERILER